MDAGTQCSLIILELARASSLVRRRLAAPSVLGCASCPAAHNVQANCILLVILKVEKQDSRCYVWSAVLPLYVPTLVCQQPQLAGTNVMIRARSAYEVCKHTEQALHAEVLEDGIDLREIYAENQVPCSPSLHASYPGIRLHLGVNWGSYIGERKHFQRCVQCGRRCQTCCLSLCSATALGDEE